MKIAVYGAGGVGGYFAGRLALAVHLIARGPHLDALRVRGLRVRSVRGDFETHLPATDDPAAIRTLRFCSFCVKSYRSRGGSPSPANPGRDGSNQLLVFADQVDPGGYPSLHFDMTHGRRMELEGLHGTLVGLARKHGIPVPGCETIYSILKPWAARNEVRISAAT
jgi:ketopantoate reductase